MFSTLSSYIWGEETEGVAQQECPPSSSPSKVTRDQSPDDWVLVGETSGPAPGNLAGGLPPLPGDSTPSQSSSSSSVAGDVVEADESVMSSGPEPASIVASRHRQIMWPRDETRLLCDSGILWPSAIRKCGRL